MNIKPNDPITQSKDLISENIKHLKRLFPTIIEEDKINFDALKQLLGEEVEVDEEFYRFTWPGKHLARKEALKKSKGTLRPVREDSVQWENTKNLYIEGDNLEVLKLLQQSYFNKVKMIYIDPPYNTGKDFVYKDNYKDNLAEYNEKFNRVNEEGQTINSATNNEGNARYHSNWLNMMYPRLQLARNLLKEDGVIFISIDDNEVHNLRRICDEVFGEENFIENYIWESTFRPDNSSKIVRENAQHIITYSRDISKIEKLLGSVSGSKGLPSLTKNSMAISTLEFPENSVEFLISDGKYSPQSFSSGYELMDNVIVKDSKNINKFRLSGRVIWGQKYLINQIENGTRIVIKSNSFVPYTKKINDNTLAPNTLIPRNIVGDVLTGRAELKNIFEKNIFEHPKPTSLIKYLISYFEESSLIIDFFSGSATTAHAVMDLNKEDILNGKQGNRKYIMVQLPEPTDEKSEAIKAGYQTLTEIGKERIRRAGNQIREELADQPEVLPQLDLGFKVFQLDSSNIHTWDTSPEELENNLELFKNEAIKEGRTAEDVLYEVLLKYGLDLTYPIEEVTLDNKKCYSVGAGQLIFCLEDGITRVTAQEIINWAKEDEIINPKIVFKDSGYANDVEKTNMIQLLKTHGITDVQSI